MQVHNYDDGRFSAVDSALGLPDVEEACLSEGDSMQDPEAADNGWAASLLSRAAARCGGRAGFFLVSIAVLIMMAAVKARGQYSAQSWSGGRLRELWALRSDDPEHVPASLAECAIDSQLVLWYLVRASLEIKDSSESCPDVKRENLRSIYNFLNATRSAANALGGQGSLSAQVSLEKAHTIMEDVRKQREDFERAMDQRLLHEDAQLPTEMDAALATAAARLEHEDDLNKNLPKSAVQSLQDLGSSNTSSKAALSPTALAEPRSAASTAAQEPRGATSPKRHLTDQEKRMNQQWRAWKQKKAQVEQQEKQSEDTAKDTSSRSTTQADLAEVLENYRKAVEAKKTAKVQQRLCAATVSGTMASFAFSASYASALTTECPAMFNQLSYCIVDITRMLAAMAEMAAGAAAISAQCTELREYIPYPSLEFERRRRLQVVETVQAPGIESNRSQTRSDSSIPGILSNYLREKNAESELAEEKAECATDIAEAVFYTARGGTDIHSALVNCEEGYYEMCAVGISGTIEAFAQVSMMVSNAVGECNEGRDWRAFCSGAVSQLAAGVATMAGGIAGAVDVCTYLDVYH